MEFKDKLKKLRIDKGLTQEYLANKLNISRTLISKYETGAVFPSEENLNAISVYFGIPVNELMSDKTKYAAIVKTSNDLFKLKLTCSIFGIFILCVITLLMTLPIFRFCYSEYKVNGDIATLVKISGNTSLLINSFSQGKPYEIITLCLCFISFCLTIINYCFYYQNKLVSLLTIGFYALTLLISILTIVIGLCLIERM